jgi:hypothetical protein
MSDPANGHPRDLLSAYLDDELGLEERASVDRHLAGCEDCRDEFEALRRLARALSEDSVPPVPADLEERIGRRLDAATVVRLRRWRFVVPATVAATLGALGLLVALQWREGPIGVPTAPTPAPASAPVPVSKKQELDRAMPMKEIAPSDALRKDLAAAPEEKAKVKPDVNAPAAAPVGVPAGTVGGVEGGVGGGVPGGSVAGEPSSQDARRERAAAAKLANEAPTLMQPASVPSARSVTRSPCAEQWSDSGLRATWSVQDVAVAVRELSRMAGDVGGIGVWRGVAEGGLYMLVVPRGKFDEVYFALRARGVDGLAAPPAVAPGNDCAGISIVITAAASPAAPPPR